MNLLLFGDFWHRRCLESVISARVFGRSLWMVFLSPPIVSISCFGLSLISPCVVSGNGHPDLNPSNCSVEWLDNFAS